MMTFCTINFIHKHPKSLVKHFMKLMRPLIFQYFVRKTLMARVKTGLLYDTGIVINRLTRTGVKENQIS